MAAILADDFFKCMFRYENYRNRIQIALKFVPIPMSPIVNMAALVRVVAWRRTGDKPFPEPMMTRFTDAYMRHFKEMS